MCIRDSYACLDAGLKMLHPFMPFVTEELWQRLPDRPGESAQTIALTAFPSFQQDHDFPRDAAAFDEVFASVRAVRGLAADYGLTAKIQAFLETGNPATREMLDSQRAVMQTLIRGCQSIETVAHDTERDNFKSAEAAREYGLVDQVLERRPEESIQPA